MQWGYGHFIIIIINGRSGLLPIPPTVIRPGLGACNRCDWCLLGPRFKLVVRVSNLTLYTPNNMGVYLYIYRYVFIHLFIPYFGIAIAHPPFNEIQYYATQAKEELM